jgi:alpha-tubulin suppressor-like RCC1 family protein/methionine-rich copper-binding protein CopC
MTRVITMPKTGVLLADQGSNAIPQSGKIFLLSDLDGDGRAIGDERAVFFDATNASGLPSPSENVFVVTQTRDGSVFIGDGASDTVYRLRDRNNDGGANDAGEATAWLSPANAAGLSTVTPNGLAEGPDGALYVVNAGVASRPQDGVYRTIDLNGDGDADDAGEATLWLDLQGVVPTSSPFTLSFSGAVAYLLDPAGTAEDVIHRIADANGDGAIAPGEVTTFIGRNAAFGAPLDFGHTGDGASLLTWQWLPDAAGLSRLYRLTDLDGSGRIDAATEAGEIWNTGLLPEGFAQFAGFSVASDGEGRVALTSNGAQANQRNVILLEDGNGDGDFLDAGETSILATAVDDASSLLRPRAVTFFEGLTQRADTIVGGGNHFSLFLDKDAGVLYAAGENVVGQLGQGVTGFDVPAPLAIPLPDGLGARIVSISAGLVHGAFLTEEGEVYTWGLGNFGRLGHGDDADLSAPKRIEGAFGGEKVAVIDMGNGASYAITESGALYAWGQNSNGQLGLGDTGHRLAPVKVEALADERVVAVSSGTSHSLALTADGDVYAFGSNTRGAIGDGSSGGQRTSPYKVVGLPDDVVAVTADTLTSFAVTADGRVFGWGEGRFGQLLLGQQQGDGTFAPQTANVTSPVELTGLPPGVIDIKGGARWVAALTEDGDVYVWGPNDEGLSGALDGDPAATSSRAFMPTKVAALDAARIVEIQTGPNHLIAVAADGTVYTMGSNGDGRLGFEGASTLIAPRIVDFTADRPPYLVSAQPSDNAAEVEVETAFVLRFTEAVEAGSGEITIVNLDDPSKTQVIDAADTRFVTVDGSQVSVLPPDYLQPGQRYAIEIAAGAFVDRDGVPYAGIAAGDRTTLNLRTVAVGVTGPLDLSADDDGAVLRGTAADDVLRGGAGDDVLLGYGGGDALFVGEGLDNIVGFAAEDMLRTERRIFDGNGDGVIAAGSPGRFDLDGRGPGTDTLVFTDTAVSALRYLGSDADGHVYARADVRPEGAIEGRIGASSLRGDAGDRRADVFFYDNALGLDLGADVIRNFGRKDQLVTTAKLRDSDGDGVIGFGANRLLELDAETGSADLGTVAIRGVRGEVVGALQLLGTTMEAGVEYHVYGLVGSMLLV